MRERDIQSDTTASIRGFDVIKTPVYTHSLMKHANQLLHACWLVQIFFLPADIKELQQDLTGYVFWWSGMSAHGDDDH